MATTHISYIQTLGGDYTGFDAWLTGEARDLTYSDEIELAYVNEAFTDEAAGLANITGFTTSPTQYVHYYVDPAYRSGPKRDASKYEITRASSTAPRVQISDDHAIFEGVQSNNTYTGSASSTVYYAATTCDGWAVFKSCFGSTSRTGSTYPAFPFQAQTPSTATTYFINCVGVSYSTNSIHATFVNNCTAGGAVYFDSCTAGGAARYGFFAYSGKATPYYKNCYSGGTSTQDFLNHTSAGSFTYCYSEDSSATTYCSDGSCSGSIAYSTANFTSVTASSEDLSLVVGSALRNNGSAAGGSWPRNYTDDIFEVTRSAWDIGAYEYPAAAASGIGWKLAGARPALAANGGLAG